MTQHLINVAIDHVNQRISGKHDPHGIRGLVNRVRYEVIDHSKFLLSKLEGELGDLAWDDKVEAAKLGETVIIGGYLRTELIEAHSIGAQHINTSELVVGDNILMGPDAKITWANFADEVVKDLNDVQMRWLGSLSTFPTSPKKNDSFYHEVNRRSYIFDGNIWHVVSQDGTIGRDGVDGAEGPRGYQGPQGERGPTGTPGSYYAPGYLQSTYISRTEIHSPTLMAETMIGDTGQVGMTTAGSGGTAIRFWAGDTFQNRNNAPFRVAQDGTVTMTKANIETTTIANMFIRMGGSKIEGGRLAQGTSYTLGTATTTGSFRSGIVQLDSYASDTSTVFNRRMQMVSNTIMVSGSNLALGGMSENRAVVIGRTVTQAQATMTIPNSAALHVIGATNITGTTTLSGNVYLEGANTFIGSALYLHGYLLSTNTAGDLTWRGQKILTA